MPTLLIRHATVLVTMDEQRREIADGGLFARDGFIQQVGPTDALPAEADLVLDLSDHLVAPGLINTHHHFYQTLTRAVPAAQNANLFNWLRLFIRFGRASHPVQSASLLRRRWLNWPCRAVPRPRITCICSPMALAWMTRSLLPKRLACACTPHAVR